MHHIKRRIGLGSGLDRRHLDPSRCESCFIASLTATSREHGPQQQHDHLSMLPSLHITNLQILEFRPITKLFQREIWLQLPGSLRDSPLGLIWLEVLGERCNFPQCGPGGAKLRPFNALLCIFSSKIASGGHVFRYFYATFLDSGWWEGWIKPS